MCRVGCLTLFSYFATNTFACNGLLQHDFFASPIADVSIRIWTICGQINSLSVHGLVDLRTGRSGLFSSWIAKMELHLEQLFNSRFCHTFLVSIFMNCLTRELFGPQIDWPAANWLVSEASG